MSLMQIKSEIVARYGAATTGASAGLTLVDAVDRYVKFAAGIVALLVGIATLTYYALAIAEKWQGRRK